MTTTHWALAAMAAVSLCFSAPALADHEKGHHGGMKHHCSKGCDMECCKKGGCDKKGCDKKGCDWKAHNGMKKCPLSAEKRQLVKEAMKNAREKNKAGHEAMMARHKALKDALSAKEFDRNAFLKAFDDMAAARATMQRNRAEAFADVAPQLTPEERSKAAMFLTGGGRGMMHHGKMGMKGCPYAGKRGGKGPDGRHSGAWRHYKGSPVREANGFHRPDWDGLNH